MTWLAETELGLTSLQSMLDDDDDVKFKTD
jgi:hypothetical protein